MGSLSLQGLSVPLYAVIRKARRSVVDDIHLGEVCEPCADQWVGLYMSAGVSRDFILYDVVDPPDCEDCEGEFEDDGRCR